MRVTFLLMLWCELFVSAADNRLARSTPIVVYFDSPALVFTKGTNSLLAFPTFRSRSTLDGIYTSSSGEKSLCQVTGQDRYTDEYRRHPRVLKETELKRLLSRAQSLEELGEPRVMVGPIGQGIVMWKWALYCDVNGSKEFVQIGAIINVYSGVVETLALARSTNVVIGSKEK